VSSRCGCLGANVFNVVLFGDNMSQYMTIKG